MRHSSFTALYDACVLYPAPLRDFLIRLGLSGRFRARWSAQIHAEWKRNLLLNRSDLTVEQPNRTSDLMDRAIPDALVTGHEDLIVGLTLPDPDDAAACRGPSGFQAARPSTSPITHNLGCASTRLMKALPVLCRLSNSLREYSVGLTVRCKRVVAGSRAAKSSP